MRGQAGRWACVVAAVVAGAACVRAEEPRVVPLDGAAVEGEVERMDAKSVTAWGKRFELQSLLRIERGVKVEPKRVPAAVYLVDGSTIRAEEVTIASEKVNVKWAGEPLALPLSVVRGVRLAQAEPGKTDPAPVPLFEQTMARGAKQDGLFVSVEGQWQVVEGAIQALDAKEVSFQWEGQTRKIAREKPYGLTLAGTKPAGDLTGQCQARLVDGSVVWGRVKSLESGKLALAANDITITLPWPAVSQLRVRSERVTFLSELDPVEVAEEAIVAFAGPWRRDRSVLHRPLTIGQTVYERGIGTHAKSKLTFAADQKYATFSATIGIDAESNGKGDCVFKVLADGKEVFAQQMRGGDKAVDVRVNISTARQVTLLVEPGEDLDLGDHADWCEARFEKAGTH